MRKTRLTLLSTSILTGYGTYTYEPLSLAEARRLIHQFQQAGKPIQSAIGHEATADLLTDLFELPVAVNRLEFEQTTADLGLIFKLKQRPPEGKVLNREEIEAIGYEFGLLRRLS